MVERSFGRHGGHVRFQIGDIWLLAQRDEQEFEIILPSSHHRSIYPRAFSSTPHPPTTTMEKTKKAVDDFMSQAGRHDTTVTESTAPAVEHQTIRPNQHEEINTAVDQEIHQDHYHRT